MAVGILRIVNPPEFSRSDRSTKPSSISTFTLATIIVIIDIANNLMIFKTDRPERVDRFSINSRINLQFDTRNEDLS